MPTSSPVPDPGLRDFVREITREVASELLQALQDGRVVPREYVGPRELAALTGVSFKTWERWRSDGTGPVFIKLSDGPRGRVLYKLADVRRWLDERQVDDA